MGYRASRPACGNQARPAARYETNRRVDGFQVKPHSRCADGSRRQRVRGHEHDAGETMRQQRERTRLAQLDSVDEDAGLVAMLLASQIRGLWARSWIT